MKTKVALFKVFDKDEIFLRFARQLLETKQWTLLAFKETAEFLTQNGVACVDVNELIGKPILGQDFAVLSPEIHIGLLAGNSEQDKAKLEAQGILSIDLVYVDLCPLKKVISSTEGMPAKESIKYVVEHTDIDGPAILRSAVKGRKIVVSSKHQLSIFILSRETDLKWLYESEFRPDYEEFIGSLAGAAEKVVASYATASGQFHEYMSSYLAYTRNKK